MGTLQWGKAERELLDRAMVELQAKTAGVDLLIHFDEATWSVDQDEGTLVWDRPNGMRAVAPVQIIGTYNTLDNTWLWAWDNPSIIESLTRNALVVRQYGEDHDIAALTTRKIACDESDGWDLTALACKLSDAQGAYRGPAGTARVYMTFGQIRMSPRSGNASSSC